MSDFIISKYCIPFLSSDEKAYFYLSNNNSLHKVSRKIYDSVCECKKSFFNKPYSREDFPKIENSQYHYHC